MPDTQKCQIFLPRTIRLISKDPSAACAEILVYVHKNVDTAYYHIGLVGTISGKKAKYM